jgi:uncharacterized coiled-coil DUF342 family protein
MSDVPAQLRLLLQRAAELREHSDDIQRKLAVVFAEINKLSTTQDQGLGPRDHPSDIIPPKTPQK